MQKHAVLLTVLFALFVTIISVSAVFWEFYKLNKSQYIDNIFSKHETITQIYREHQQKNTSDIMLEAKASEHSSRMIAMKNAKESANKIADNLTLEYNKARQAMITREVSEITA